MRLERAERRWSGRCIVAASGPSLTPEVAEMCRGERVIAVNDAYLLLPFADVLYACDEKWYEHHGGCAGFAGEKWTSHSLSPKNVKSPQLVEKYGLKVICGDDKPGFSRNPAFLFYGNNSGYQATNLAILFGADPVILAGFDMRPVDGKTHFFGRHKAPLQDGSQFAAWCSRFAKAAELLGGSPRIINATPGSALKCFPMMPLEQALASGGQQVA